MIDYLPYQIGEQSGYTLRITDSSGKIVSMRNVIVPLNIIKQDDFYYFFLLDDDNRIIHDAYRYLNRKCADKPYNTRKQLANGIRLLYCFLSLTGYDMHNLKDFQIHELVSFIQGTSLNFPKETERVLRSPVTVNIYLSAIRNYFSSLNIENKSLNRSHSVKMTMGNRDNFNSSIERTRYDVNLKTTNSDSRMTPKYISPDDFRKLYIIAKKHNDTQAMILMHLMYGYGLRLGECLGLTAPEDIKEVHRNKELVPVIYIRNRLSDNPKFQSAKGKAHILEKAQYKTTNYQSSRDEIPLTWNFYNQLIAYVNETQEYYAEHYPDNYAAGTADIVSLRMPPEYNHYIFMNRFGRVLNDQTWNNHLKAYFLEAGLHIDTDVKENGLSHRFRHGFAMFHAQFSPHKVDALQLCRMMRHRDPSTTMVYYNPTPEDEAKMKEEAAQYLYDEIPELLNTNIGGDNN